MAEIKETFHTVVKALILNLTNLNSKRLVVTILFEYFCYALLMAGGLGIDPNIIFGAMVGVAGYWIKKESENPTNLEVGEKMNGYFKKDKPNEAQG